MPEHYALSREEEQDGAPRVPRHGFIHYLAIANAAGLIGLAMFVGGIVYNAGARANQMDSDTQAIARQQAAIDTLDRTGGSYARGVMEEIRNHLSAIDQRLNDMEQESHRAQRNPDRDRN